MVKHQEASIQRDADEFASKCGAFCHVAEHFVQEGHVMVKKLHADVPKLW